MAVLKAARTAQQPLVAEFVFNFNDTAVDTVALTSKTFGSTYTDALVFDAIPMPVGAVICGGEVVVETAYVGPTASTVSVGIAGATTSLAATVDLLTATRTALTLSTTAMFKGNTGTNIRLTFAHTVANATAGKARVRVMYTLDGRAQENIGA